MGGFVEGIGEYEFHGKIVMASGWGIRSLFFTDQFLDR